MDQQRRELWGSYFTHLANRVGLYDWRILVTEDCTPNDEIAADIFPIRGKKVARVRLSADWEDYEPHLQREYAVHELMHPHFEQQEQYVLDLINTYTTKAGSQFLFDHYVYLSEFGIDAVARIIASTLGLPGDVVAELAQTVQSEQSGA